MNVVFDLDGVIRDLNVYFRDKYGISYPKVWYWKHKGKDFWWWCDKDKNLAPINAKPTEYYKVIKKHCKEIWTCQPMKWRKKTKHWIKEYLGDCKIRFLDTKQKRARLDKYKDIILVEDCPNFSNYERIILIDRPYNRKTKALRVKTPESLERLLNNGHRI
jgi:hypothetical protein